MKSTILGFVFLSVMAIGGFSVQAMETPGHTFPTAPATDSMLIVSLSGIASEKGYVLVAIYKDPKTWNDPSRAFYTRKVKARKGALDIEFAKLAPGNYAIAAVHDEDDNGGMTFNMLGMPTEAYGFGNNARGVVRAPGFEEALVRFSGSGRVAITLK